MPQTFERLKLAVPPNEGLGTKDGILSQTYIAPALTSGGRPIVKPNYSFAKRQRDLAKKAKKEEKRIRKTAEPAPAAPEPGPTTASEDKLPPL